MAGKHQADSHPLFQPIQHVQQNIRHYIHHLMAELPVGLAAILAYELFVGKVAPPAYHEAPTHAASIITHYL